MKFVQTVTLLAILAACFAPTSFATEPPQSGTSNNKTVSTGTWGGIHLRMEVTEKGAELEFDCGTANIAEPLTLDANGRFQVKGTLGSEGPGATRINEQPRNSDATFKGKVTGDKMQLEISTPGEKETQVYTLVRGANSRLMKIR